MYQHKSLNHQIMDFPLPFCVNIKVKGISNYSTYFEGKSKLIKEKKNLIVKYLNLSLENLNLIYLYFSSPALNLTSKGHG